MMFGADHFSPLKNVTLLLLLPAIFSIAIPLQALAQSATTGKFQQSGAGIPISAETTFFNPTWTTGDQVRTAQHELLHAIGFAKAYDDFRSHIDSTRQFRLNDDQTGSVLGKLTPEAQGTHIDPAGGTVNGFNQANSVMGPSNVANQRMGGQEKSILDAGFDWVGTVRNINIAVTFNGTWSPAGKKIMTDAVAAAKVLLESDGTGPTFTWTVKQSAAPSILVAGEVQSMDLAPLIDQLGSPNGNLRVQAAAALLARPEDAVVLLTGAGAKDMRGLNPSLADVVYSIVGGDRPGRYRANSLGLHLEPGTSPEDVAAMAERAGFVLSDGVECDPESHPSCYVTIAQGRELWDVMARLIVGEPRIRTLSLDYFEQ